MPPSGLFESVDGMEIEAPAEELIAPKIHTVFYYAGHIIVSYVMHPDLDLYRVNGPLIDRLELDKLFRPSKLRLA